MLNLSMFGVSHLESSEEKVDGGQNTKYAVSQHDGLFFQQVPSKKAKNHFCPINSLNLWIPTSDPSICRRVQDWTPVTRDHHQSLLTDETTFSLFKYTTNTISKCAPYADQTAEFIVKPDFYLPLLHF